MFCIETLHNPIVDKLISRGVSELIEISPLDNVNILAGLPEAWEFKPTCMPKLYANYASVFANFKVRKDDIWIVTYPKCGTTWTQEMAWMLMNDLNFDEAYSVDITKRTLFFELNGMVKLDAWNTLEALEMQKSPRVIKSHLPISLLPRDIWNKKCKIIYVARDPKDVVVSFFHHSIGMTPFNGNIADFVEGFLADNYIYSSFWHHVLEFWKIRQQENIMFLTYEDMKKNLRSIIEEMCVFLGKNYNPEQINRLLDHLSFEKMKENPTCNNQGLVKSLYGVCDKEYKDDTAFKFMRKGVVGGFKNDLPSHFVDKINLKTKEIFQPHGLHLYINI